MQNDIRTLIPQNKFDTDRAEQAVAAGYPAVEPILPELLEWIQDSNWPVARVLAPFLGSIGTPLIPHIRKILATDDTVWKYWTLTYLVQGSRDVAAALREDLQRYANSPTPDETAEGLDEVARTILRETP
ncbi:MAG TPA: DUF5071 domain-containing protein [Pyrinomonadaceae bacterium]|nr:DUF5071 domain-containing protein [Pyrinomonadaceae bacterium]